MGVFSQLIIPEWCNACAAAFERYRIAGCEGVFMKGYTVGGIEKQKEIPKNMADKLL